MPPPISVEIVPYSADWPERARREIEQLTDALGPVLYGVHHIGSTAVPGLAAKPIFDLMPVVADISLIHDAAPILEGSGYRGWGELWISGRRYFTRDTQSGTRVAQLHCFPLGPPHVERHLAFRDYLRAHHAIASAYQSGKQRCSGLHPRDSHAYSDYKADWIIRVEAEALRWYRSTASGPP
jgi:GrpB-like predicted nucleotidyltransferase (UPF0157 family)